MLVRHRADDGRRLPRLGGVSAGQLDGSTVGLREWALDRIRQHPVIDVVDHQSVEVEAVQPFDGGARDLRESLWRAFTASAG